METELIKLKRLLEIVAIQMRVRLYYLLSVYLHIYKVHEESASELCTKIAIYRSNNFEIAIFTPFYYFFIQIYQFINTSFLLAEADAAHETSSVVNYPLEMVRVIVNGQ